MKKLRNNSSGDTIVEVLIVLTILSFSFGISYATAKGGLTRAQNSQEHSQALGYINSQIELVRSAVVKNNQNALLKNGNDFCMDTNGDPALSGSVLTSTPPNCQQQNGRYNVTAKYHDVGDSAKNYYHFNVTWDGLGTLGSQHEDLTYKILQVSTLAAGTPYQGGNPGGGYQNNQPPPAPPPPPARGPFSWNKSGAEYTSCAQTETILPDSHNGCFPATSSTGSLYARRAIKVRYTLDNVASGPITAGPAVLTIQYKQYQTAGTFPGPGYNNFILATTIDSTSLGNLSLPIESSNSSWPVHTQSFNVNIAADSPNYIEFDWTNNTGVDPDLQINRVTLSYTP